MSTPYFGLPAYYESILYRIDKRSFQLICKNLKQYLLSYNYVYAFLELYFIAQAPEKKISFADEDFSHVVKYWHGVFPKLKARYRWSGVDFLNDAYIEKMKQVYTVIQKGDVKNLSTEIIEKTLKDAVSTVYMHYGGALGVKFKKVKTTIERFK